MNRVKVHPGLRLAWRDGRMLLRVPGRRTRTIGGEGVAALLSDFARPRSVDEVVEGYDDPDIARENVATLFRLGALILEGETRTMPRDLLFHDDGFVEIQSAVAPFTMGTPAINYALFSATRYIVQHEVPGAIVESGVWRGGSAMICALTLLALGETDRDLYLFDVFDGSWPERGPEDGTIYDDDRTGSDPSPLTPEEVRRLGLDAGTVRDRVAATGYPMDRVHLVHGLVQETMPRRLPEEIALLRLDTDYFASTYHELRHGFPRLSAGGILLVDDYPTEKGATRAVERYLAETGQRIFLGRIDVQGRIGVKQLG